jgi:hypothetical protein
MGRALQLSQAGRARAAREALLLGQRFLRAARALGQDAAAAQAQAGGETDEDPQFELWARLINLLHHERRRRAHAAIGIDPVHKLDLEAFRTGDGWRVATREERARIQAGDWPRQTPSVETPREMFDRLQMMQADEHEDEDPAPDQRGR